MLDFKRVREAMKRRTKVRRFLRKNRHECPECATLLNNSELFEQFLTELEREHTRGVGGPWADFFQMLIDNREGLLELIRGIVDMFKSEAS